MPVAGRRAEERQVVEGEEAEAFCFFLCVLRGMRMGLEP